MLTTNLQAYVLLGQLIHSYVNGSKVPYWLHLHTEAHTPGTSRETVTNVNPDVKDSVVAAGEMETIPKQLARPFATVCTRLGVPLVLCAAGMDLWNFRRQVLLTTRQRNATIVEHDNTVLHPFRLVENLLGFLVTVYLQCFYFLFIHHDLSSGLKSKSLILKSPTHSLFRVVGHEHEKTVIVAVTSRCA